MCINVILTADPTNSKQKKRLQQYQTRLALLCPWSQTRQSGKCCSIWNKYRERER